MPHGPTIFLPAEGVRIPGNLFDLEAFRIWAGSDSFPQKGRIDWIAGELEVDMSPEDVNTHGTVKAAVARGLAALIEDRDLGVVLIDSTRYTCAQANLSCEPDVLVVCFVSVDANRVRLIPKASGEAGRFVEVEGVADLVVECVSDSSEGKDLARLRDRYGAAGVTEYWLVDARVAPPVLTLFRRGDDGTHAAVADSAGFVRSEVAGAWVRLVRLPPRSGLVRYRLETRP